tara:strand:+ start:563 stop:754 length:192 start_codon:yes stop_codon:yes gene_type:complete
MRNIKLLDGWNGNPCGARIGVEDSIAENLIAQGLALDPNASPIPAPAAAKKKAKKKAKRKSKK